MKRLMMAGAAVLALAGLAACQNPYPESRAAAEAAGQSQYAVRYNTPNGQVIRIVFIDPTTGCEYWDDDQLPRNGADGKQVCAPTSVASAIDTSKPQNTGLDD